MVNYRQINDRHPELEELTPHSAEWYRQWRTAHLTMFPNIDQRSRDNLDDFVREAEEREMSELTEDN